MGSRSLGSLVSVRRLKRGSRSLAAKLTGKSEKVFPGDPVWMCDSISRLVHGSLDSLQIGSLDLVITDPPFGGLLHYSELADFFYVWLRLVLKDKYPDFFSAEYTPKSLEVVANRAREPEDPDGFYQRLLTQCWREAHRILKPGGILAFTFHHSEDEPWVAVWSASSTLASISRPHTRSDPTRRRAKGSPDLRFARRSSTTSSTSAGSGPKNRSR